MSSEYPIIPQSNSRFDEHKPSFIDANAVIENIRNQYGRVIDEDGAWNYRVDEYGNPTAPKPGDCVFIKRLSDHVRTQTDTTMQSIATSPNQIEHPKIRVALPNFMQCAIFFMLTSVASAYIYTQDQFERIVDKPTAGEDQLQEGREAFENQYTLQISQNQNAPEAENDEAQEYSENADSSTSLDQSETLENPEFVQDFNRLKEIVSNANIQQRVAYEHFNNSEFISKLTHIVKTYNRLQKMQVFDYLENLHIIPASAREIVELNTSAMLKVYKYLEDFQSESNIERQERVKQRAYTLLLRAIVEREPVSDLSFVINSFNPRANLNSNSSYEELIESISMDSNYLLDPSKILAVEPFESRGLMQDVENFMQIYQTEIEHTDVITARTFAGIGLHEIAPRFTQVENQEQANMLLLMLFDYNPWNVVRFRNGVLTLGPTQLQDWNNDFGQFPEHIQNKVQNLGDDIGVQITDMVSAMRAAVIQPEITFLLGSALMSANYDTLDRNIEEFRTAGIAQKRRALIYANKIGAGSGGIRTIRKALQKNTLNSVNYITSVYSYITKLLDISK